MAGYYTFNPLAAEQRVTALAWEVQRLEHKLDHVLGVVRSLVDTRATTQVSYFLIFIPDDV